jgi:hypothetical protein
VAILNSTGSLALADVHNAALVGKARALLDLGDFADAHAAAAQVPTTATYFVRGNADDYRLWNGVFMTQNQQRRWTVSDGEGVNGLPYRTDADLRVPFTQNGFGANGTVMYMQQKYPSRGADVPLASGLEARLIDAEFYYQQGDLANMTVNLNIVRAQLGVTPLPTPPSSQALQTLFKERAYTLWLTSHRLGDMRRLIRQYDFSRAHVFPSGDYPLGGQYGNDVNFPIPDDPLYNTEGFSCIDVSA